MKTEAESVAEIARRIEPTAEIVTLQGGPAPIIIHHASKKREVETLERLMVSPVRKRAALTLRDHASFIEYVERHKEEGTIILAEVNEQGGNFTAILDYHTANKPAYKIVNSQPIVVEPGSIVPDGVTLRNAEMGQPRWGEHVCKYVCEHTPEWKRWMALSGKGQSQLAMALFIEDNLFDIIDPEPARMLELVKTLEATQGVEFKSAIRLQNGDRQLNYSHTTTAKAGQQGDMDIPEKFTLRFPVFVNGPVYDITCRFRYNIKDGSLVMAFEVERPHKVIDLALSEARNAIVTTLRLPVLLGAGTITKV